MTPVFWSALDELALMLDVLVEELENVVLPAERPCPRRSK